MSLLADKFDPYARGTRFRQALQQYRQAGMSGYDAIARIAQASNFPEDQIADAMDPPHENVILATVGLPRSGKSSWARETNYPIVSPDAIRIAFHGERYQERYESWVWGIAPVMVDSLFEAGHEIVLFDSTLVSEKRRAGFRRRHQNRNIIWICFDTSVSDCMSRADDQLRPVIERMSSELEWPEIYIERVPDAC